LFLYASTIHSIRCLAHSFVAHTFGLAGPPTNRASAASKPGGTGRRLITKGGEGNKRRHLKEKKKIGTDGTF
jgi:hypothetical protein